MTAVALGRFEPASQEWQDARRLRIGGSEIAAVLGLSPFTSRYSLWHEKASGIRTFDGNDYTDWGTRLEPVVAAKFCEDHPELKRLELQGYTYAHPEREWQTASPDLRLIVRDRDNDDFPAPARDLTFLEVKTARRDDAWYDGIPLYYRTQVLWTMDVLGVDHAWLAVLISGSDYREYPVVLDAEAEADLAIMREAGQKFIDSLMDGTPPDIDDSYSTYQTMRRVYPDIDAGVEHEIDRETAELFIEANNTFDEAKRAQQYARNAIARHMGRANYATCEGTRIARRQPARDGGPPILVSTRKSLPEPQESAA